MLNALSNEQYKFTIEVGGSEGGEHDMGAIVLVTFN